MILKIFRFTPRDIALSIFLVLSLGAARGQNYSSMLADSNAWYVVLEFEGCHNSVYKTSGDTTIHGLSYKKIQTENYVRNWNTVGYLREDSLLKKVYSKVVAAPLVFDSALTAYYDTTEFVYYDFNLNTGDSIFLITPSVITGYYQGIGQGADSLGWYYVDSVSSVSTAGGNRKVIYLNSYQTNPYCSTHLVWVEGVGAIYGPYLGCEGLNRIFLSCFYKNNVQEYFKGYNDTATGCICDLSGGIDMMADWKNSLSLSPNPSDDQVALRLVGGEQTLSASLLDLSGRELQTLFTDRRIASFQFSTQSLISGLYFIKVTNQQGESAMLKLVRQ